MPIGWLAYQLFGPSPSLELSDADLHTTKELAGNLRLVLPDEATGRDLEEGVSPVTGGDLNHYPDDRDVVTLERDFGALGPDPIP